MKKQILLVALIFCMAFAVADEDPWADIDDGEPPAKSQKQAGSWEDKTTTKMKAEDGKPTEEAPPMSFIQRHGMLVMYVGVMLFNKLVRGYFSKKEPAAPPGGLVRAVHTDAEWKEVVEGHKKNKDLVLVDFSASWCGPCKAIAPEFERLSLKYSTTKFIKIDCVEMKDVAKAYGISAYPTFVIYRGSEKLGEVAGASVPKIEELLRTNGAKEVPVDEASTQANDKTTEQGKNE